MRQIRIAAKAEEWLLPVGLIGAYLALSILWQDIHFYDESFYLASGSQIKASMFIHDLSGAPLYVLWYHLLAYVCPNPVWLYFFSWALLLASVSLLPFLTRIPRSWLYTAVIVSIPFFNIGPYVSLFAASFVLMGLCVVLKSELSAFSSLVLSCILCFVVAFSRPEYAYGVFLSVPAVAIVFLINRESISRPWNAAKLLTVICVAFAMAFVMNHSDSSRSGVAFLQHVNIRAAQKGLLGSADPWISSYAQNSYHVGLNPTITDCFRSNPRLFLHHVFDNLLDKRFVVLLIMLAGGAVWPAAYGKRPGLRIAGLFLCVVSLPVVASSLLIYPERHYMAIVFPALLLLFLQMPQLPEKQPSSLIILTLGAVAIFTCNILGRVVKNGQVNNRSGILTVECLRSLETNESPQNDRMFDPLGIPDVYLKSKKSRTSINDFADWNAFQIWITKTRPYWVLINHNVSSQYTVSPETIDLLLRKQLGYSLHTCPTTTDLTVYQTPD